MERGKCYLCGREVSNQLLEGNNAICIPCKNNKDQILKRHDYKKKHVINNFRSINTLFLSCTSIGLIIILIRFLGYKEFEWNSVKLTLEDSWIVFACITIAHLYLAKLTLFSLKSLNNEYDYKIKGDTYLEIVTGDLIFTRGMIPRTHIRLTDKMLPFPYQKKDHTHIIRFGIIAVIFLAIFCSKPFLPFNFKLLMLASVICYSNWIIGSFYLIEFFKLVNENKETNSYITSVLYES